VPRAKRKPEPFQPKAKTPEEGWRVLLKGKEFFVMAGATEVAGPFPTHAMGRESPGN
jgi:hypothetical protein